MSSTDPLGIISNPPSTVVKVQGTSRDDLNGQCGIAVQYNTERGRYMVHMAATGGTSMALKPENLLKANMLESYKAKFQVLRNDPRVQQEWNKYYAMAQNKLRPVKPEHAAGVVGLVLVAMMYFVGFTRTLMVVSMLIMLGIILGPDLARGVSSPRVLAANFPARCKQVLEQSAPQFLQGRLTNNMAAGIVLAALLFSASALFASSSSRSRSPPWMMANNNPNTNYATTANSGISIEEAYKLGFEDATQGNEFGSSMTTTTTTTTLEAADAAAAARSSLNENNLDPLVMGEYDIISQPTTTQPASKFGFSQLMALFYIYRTATELGGNPLDGTFSIQLAMANLRNMQPMKMGLLGFCLYNLFKGFF